MLAVADVTGMAPGARVGYLGVPLDIRSGEIDFGIAEETLRNGSVGLSEARALDIFKQRIDDEGIPDGCVDVAGHGRLRGERCRAVDHRTGRHRRRQHAGSTRSPRCASRSCR